MAKYVSTHTGEQIDSGVDIALNNVITKDNITSYTPSGDYNPATKTYVDTKFNFIKWEGTQAQYDALTTPQKTQYLFYAIIEEEEGG